MVRSEIQHQYNALHYYCRLLRKGLNAACALQRALEWEAIHAPVLYPGAKPFARY